MMMLKRRNIVLLSQHVADVLRPAVSGVFSDGFQMLRAHTAAS
jgi:hypothetical protein